MNEDKFWELVQKAHNFSGGDMDKKCSKIKATIASLPKNDALDFLRIFYAMMDIAYSWPLWAAANIIGGVCSDDGFFDFRATLISRGRDTFSKAVTNPDLLADEQLDKVAWFYEGYQYAVFDGVECAAGVFSGRGTPWPEAPSGQRWSGNDFHKTLPALTKKLGKSRSIPFWNLERLINAKMESGYLC